MVDPLRWSDGPAALLATVLLLVFATTYSLVGVPYQALVPVMTSDYDERTQLVRYKACCRPSGRSSVAAWPWSSTLRPT